jgi:hypothetical protein
MKDQLGVQVFIILGQTGDARAPFDAKVGGPEQLSANQCHSEPLCNDIEALQCMA